MTKDYPDLDFDCVEFRRAQATEIKVVGKLRMVRPTAEPAREG